jgi:hypothetical protein
VSLVCFWPEEFSSGRLGASDWYSDSNCGLADEKKKKSRPCHMKHRVGPSARSAGFCKGQKQINNLHKEPLEPAACQQHGHDIMLFNSPRDKIQYSYNHCHFAETRLRLSGSMRVAVCVTCISWNTSIQAKTRCQCNCFRRCSVLPCSVQHDKSLYDTYCGNLYSKT